MKKVGNNGISARIFTGFKLQENSAVINPYPSVKKIGYKMDLKNLQHCTLKSSRTKLADECSSNFHKSMNGHTIQREY